MQEGTEEFLKEQRAPRNAVQIYFLFDTLKSCWITGRFVFHRLTQEMYWTRFWAYSQVLPEKTPKLPWKHPPIIFLGKILEEIFFQFWTVEFFILKGLFLGGWGGWVAVGSSAHCMAELAAVIKCQYMAPSFASKLFGKN